MTAAVHCRSVARLLGSRLLKRASVTAALVAAILATSLVPFMGGLDRRLSDLWFGLSKVEPSGRLMLVDISHAALQSGDGLRLPRARLAQLLDDLAASGAERILLDLTLVGETSAADDAALEAALHRLGSERVAVTASAMALADASGVSHWRRSATLDRFARQATQVASDLAFDADGRLRRTGVNAADLASMVPAADWLVRTHGPNGPRPLDFGIDIRSVPMVDALDVLTHSVGEGRFVGHDVVVANYTTAIGQDIAVPRFGSLRRPEITLLSGETALRDLELHPLALWATLIGIASLAALTALWTARLGAMLGLIVALCGTVGVLGSAVLSQNTAGLMLPGAEFVLALATGYGAAQVATHPTLRRLRAALGDPAELRLARVLDETGEALVTFSPDGRILSMNTAAHELFAYAPTGDDTSMADLIGDQADVVMSASAASRPGQVEATIERGIAGRRHLDFRVNTMRAGAGEWIGIATVRDVTDHRAQLEALRRLATQDPLTGLPNRLGFENAVAEGCRTPAEEADPMAVLLCDLDGFKAVNDTLGHQAGDALLREIGGRLRASVASDAVVARLGGDEFGLVLRSLGMDAAAAARVAEGLVAAVRAPIAIEGRPVRVGVSIGIAIQPLSGRTPEALIRAADAAMYRAKRARTGFACDLDRTA